DSRTSITKLSSLYSQFTTRTPRTKSRGNSSSGGGPFVQAPSIASARKRSSPAGVPRHWLASKTDSLTCADAVSDSEPSTHPTLQLKQARLMAEATTPSVADDVLEGNAPGTLEPIQRHLEEIPCSA